VLISGQQVPGGGFPGRERETRGREERIGGTRKFPTLYPGTAQDANRGKGRSGEVVF
jgi:hypothetical protein